MILLMELINAMWLIDFSLREATFLARLSADHSKPMVVEPPDIILRKNSHCELSSKVPIVWAGNFSTGVNLLFYLTEQAAKL